MKLIATFDSMGYDLYENIYSTPGESPLHEYIFIDTHTKHVYKILNDTLYLWSLSHGRKLWQPVEIKDKKDEYKKNMLILFMKEQHCLN